MYNFKSLHCSYCNSVMLNLPRNEAMKMNGLTFGCECCGNKNHLSNMQFTKVIQKENDTFEKIYSIDKIEQVV
jgi:hypothetical protein